jgi:hypothetical protein
VFPLSYTGFKGIGHVSISASLQTLQEQEGAACKGNVTEARRLSLEDDQEAI